jgi:peptide/nickel transport system ATP-binding protein
MSDEEILLDIRGLTVELPPGADRRHAVEGVDLSLRRNEILCIVGESGSGKSLTAKAVMGLLPRNVRATAGSILLNGEDLLKAPEARMRALRGSSMAMIFQEPMTALNPLKTVGDQVGEAIAAHTDWPRARRLAKIEKLFEDVQLPDVKSLMRSYPHQLSGGQRQRVMIAMALALDPVLLIADEPTTALDVTTQSQILALIKEIQRSRHMSVVFVTHDFGVVSDIADRVAVMRHGVVVETGTCSQVLRSPQQLYTKQLIAAIPSMTPAAPRNLEGADVVLSVRSLSKTYTRRLGFLRSRGAERKAVDNVEFTLRRGEVWGLIGESGSGKSTAARCIARLVDADAGQIRLLDTDLQALKRRQLRPFRKRIQMIFQDPYGSLNPRLTVGRIISEGPMLHGVDAGEAGRRTRELLQLVGLDPECARRYPHEFSGGQRQRIGIARALAMDPEVLIADEPVSALDVSVQAQVLALLADIRDRFNLSMLFITHDLRVAAQLCDSVAVMQRGVIVEQGPVARVFASPEHPYTRELFAAVPGRSGAQGGRFAAARTVGLESPAPGEADGAPGCLAIGTT